MSWCKEKNRHLKLFCSKLKQLIQPSIHCSGKALKKHNFTLSTQIHFFTLDNTQFPKLKRFVE